MNIEEITDILTIRYHPTKSALIQPLAVNDFSPNSSSSKYNISIVDDIIKKNIKKTILSDTISIALSGGIDSALVLAKIREVLPNINIHCISVGFYENDADFIAAKKLSKIHNCEFHGLIVENPLETLPQQVSLSQEPRWNTFWYYVAQEARKYSDILVSGDGGDEVFGGYVFRYKPFIESLTNGDSWIDRTRKYLNCHNRDWVPDQKNIFTKRMNFDWQNIYNKLRSSFDNTLTPINQVLLADFNGKLLYDWVPVNKRIHSHFKINGYSPLVDNNLVNFATHIPHNQKYDKNTNNGKIPLRQLLQNDKYDNVLVKNKKGYAPDLLRLWKKYGKKLCETYVINGDAIKYKIINKEWVETAFEHTTNNDMRYISKMLSILSLEIWCELYISKQIKPNHLL